MSDNTNIPVSIHLINTNRLEATSFAERVAEMMSVVKDDERSFTKSPIARKDFGKFNVELYYSIAQYPPKWRGFLAPLLDKRSTLAGVENRTNSFVCFVGLDDNMFAITGGFEGQKLARFMVNDFGLEILVRLFDRDSKVVKNIQDRGLTGNLLGQTKFYRGDQRFSDENQFGKIFKQVEADVNRTMLKEVFGFTDGQLHRESSGCMAKDSFQIHKAVNFDTMLMLVEKLAKVMEKKPKFSLNKVEHITRRRPQNQQLLDELNAWAKNMLYTACKKNENPDVDFCHKRFDEFMNCDSIQLAIERGTSIDVPKHSSFGKIVTLLKFNNDYDDTDEDHFNASVLDRKLVSYDSEGKKMTSGLVIDHVHGEFQYKDKTYFLLDDEWYTILPAFLKELNEECKEILKYAWDSAVLDEKFDLKKRESTYNQKYINKPNFFVFDTITPDNMESCDIMKYNDSAIDLVHVKKGFDNSIRDLAAQINIAAKRIQDDLRTGYGYIEKVEKQTRKSKEGDLSKQKFPAKGLASIFKDRSPQQISFCLAFADKAVGKRSLRDQYRKVSV
jgi:uncharacterized protein (TIGR04141 family)